jgi:hypothetical protein
VEALRAKYGLTAEAAMEKSAGFIRELVNRRVAAAVR